MSDELVARGGRVALGCDAENAGDAVDVLRDGRCITVDLEAVRLEAAERRDHLLGLRR